MHTDHSPYHGTPGYLQFMFQALCEGTRAFTGVLALLVEVLCESDLDRAF